MDNNDFNNSPKAYDSVSKKQQTKERFDKSTF